MKHIIIYIYPLFINLIVGVLMFVGPMRASEQGASLTAISLMLTNYGVGYIVFSLLMGRVVKDHLAKIQVMVAAFAVAVMCFVLGFIDQVVWVIVIYTFIPLWTSLFFNAFQSYMKHVQIQNEKPMAYSISSYLAALAVGFALGSMLSGTIREYMSWNAAYFTAGIIALSISGMVLFIRPENTGNTVQSNATVVPKRPVLTFAGWSGSFSAIIIISLFLTIFPKQSELLQLSSLQKGLVIFLYNIIQAVAVQFLPKNYTWLYQYKKAPLASLFGIVCLVLFFIASNVYVMYLGALFLGVFATITFFAAILHSMADLEHSVRNIAINETAVGTGFLVGPQFIHLTLGFGDFRAAFLSVALGIVLMMIFQFIYIRNKTLKFNG